MEEPEEHPELIGEDPASDFILYKEMEKEDSKEQRNNKAGCCVLFLSLTSLLAAFGFGASYFFVFIFKI
jgi:hypothetical protein